MINSNSTELLSFNGANKIDDYNTLVDWLHPKGKFQLRVYSVCIAVWIMAGLMQTFFQVNFKDVVCMHSLDLLLFIGLIIMAQVSMTKGCKKSVMIGTGAQMLGFMITMYGNIVAVYIGVVMIILGISSQACLFLNNMTEFSQLRIIRIVTYLSILCYCVFKVIGTRVAHLVCDYFPSGELPINRGGVALLFLPIVVLNMGATCLLWNSPRELIETDLNKAQQLFNTISVANNLESRDIKSIFDQRFAIKLINLRKYNYLTLLKYNSLGFSQTCLAVSMLLLGMINQYPNYLISLRLGSAVQANENIEMISSFQGLGVLIAWMIMKGVNTKKSCVFTAITIALNNTILLIAYVATDDLWQQLVLLGLNGILTITMYTVLIVTTIEFYPHTVRNLGLGVIMAMFFLGKVIFDLYSLLEPNVNHILEFFMTGSWVLVLYNLGISGNQSKLKYEIKEVEDQENEEL